MKQSEAIKYVNEEEEGRPLTVGTYLPDWLQGKQALRPSTRASYESHIRLHLLPHLGHVPLAELRADHIERMYQKIAGSNPERSRAVSPATMRRIHATLTSALSTAERRGLVVRNAASRVELARSPRPAASAWTSAEFARFLDLIDGDRPHLLFLLLGMRGLRRGEGVALRWRDVDLQVACIRIERSAVSVNGQTVFGPPKSSSGVRTVAVDRQTSAKLHWHGCRQRLENRDRIGTPVLSELVFTDSEGAALDPTYVSRHFDRLVKKHGLLRIRLHDLRHTSASIGLASGETLLEVSRRLGHSSISVTADIYSHIAPLVASESAERLAAVVYGSAGPDDRTPGA
ncbi:site-specific integrase [Nocardioides cavernae]|uniref:Site-specific integrase n=1 Tax=Nocardioides cavernae TaxID=1921566 RepID=A0ABR8NEN4_9ACTN|nr:site-specific integrase [Nocardioides cavernae]MBD3926576.1 site-specific integrase [Nocardioides cavernae]MBM7512295.1 integrase [Nocardioides cavernae]